MRQSNTTRDVRTAGPGLADVTSAVEHRVAVTGIATDLLTPFVRHTSASLPIQENADRDGQADRARFLVRLVPEGDALFRHHGEGPDERPAHVWQVAAYLVGA